MSLISSGRAELLRLRGWPATWTALGVWVLLTVMFGYVLTYFSYLTGDVRSTDPAFVQLLPASVPEVLLQGMPMFGSALMLVLGGLVAGNGYGWGTWKTVFTKVSPRIAIGGSILALTVLVVAVVLLTAALSLSVAIAIAFATGDSLAMPAAGTTVRSLPAGVLILELWALAGYTVGTLARGPALAIGLGLVWSLVIENVLRGFGALLGPVESLLSILPGTASGSLVGALTKGVPSEGDGGAPGVLHDLSATRAVWTIAAYLIVLVLVPLAVAARRDGP